MRKIVVVIMWVLVVGAIIYSIRFLVHVRKVQGTDFDDLEKYANEEAYVQQEYLKICNKCRCGEEIDKLTEEERVVFVTQKLATEVNNGGFYQFYENSSGDFANEVITALETLGAERILDICRKTNAIFGELVPTDRDVRNAVLTHKVTFEQINILEECSKEFDEASRELTERSYQYLNKSRKEEEQMDKLDFTSRIANILAKYVGSERVVVKRENKIDVVTLRDDESLRIENYDDSLILWLFSYEFNDFRDDDEETLETIENQLELIFTKPVTRIKTYKANKLIKEVYKLDEENYSTDYSHWLWGLTHFGGKREEITIINYDPIAGKFTEISQ